MSGLISGQEHAFTMRIFHGRYLRLGKEIRLPIPSNGPTDAGKI